METVFPFPTICTARTILRPIKLTDQQFIFELRSDEIVNQYLDRPLVKDLAQASEFINFILQGIQKNKWLYWTIELQMTQEAIGTICLWNFETNQADIGYELLPNFQKKGIMSEALQAILDFGLKTLGLEIIQAYTHRNNQASLSLLRKKQFMITNKNPEEDNYVIFELDQKSSKYLP